MQQLRRALQRLTKLTPEHREHLTEFMILDQIGTLLTGVIAVWLTQHKRESWRRWACIFGLLGQPFWFYAAWKAEQWGILGISVLYTYAWVRGSWTYWIAPDRTGPALNKGEHHAGGPDVAARARADPADPRPAVSPPPQAPARR